MPTSLSGEIDDEQTHIDYSAAVEVRIGRDVTKIGSAAFAKSSVLNLRKVEFAPDCSNFTDIGEEAFFMSDISAVAGVQNTALSSIGNSAFLECYNLAEFNFPSTLRHIGNSAFS